MITLKELSFSYSRKKEVLDRINLEVGSGHISSYLHIFNFTLNLIGGISRGTNSRLLIFRIVNKHVSFAKETLTCL